MIRKIFTYIIVILTLSSAIGLCSDAKRGVYVVNNDFEDGANGWRSWYNDSYENGYINSAVTDFSFSGSHSLKVRRNSTVWQDIGTDQLKQGNSFDFSVYVYLDDIYTYSDMPTVLLNSVNSAGLGTELKKLTPDSSANKGEWLFLEANGIIAPAGTSSIQIVLENHTDNYIYYDNIKVFADVDSTEVIVTDTGTPITWRPGMEIPETAGMGESETSKTIIPETKINLIEISENKTFSDTKDHWAETEINYLASCGIILGVSEQSFEPEREITNNEFNLLIKRITNRGFDNVDEPDEIITREAAAVILVDLMPSKMLIFDDTPAANFYDYDNMQNGLKIANAVYNNILMGKPGNLFDPKGSLTRAESAVILTRFIKLFYK